MFSGPDNSNIASIESQTKEAVKLPALLEGEKIFYLDNDPLIVGLMKQLLPK
jgi:hypothetical protein